MYISTIEGKETSKEGTERTKERKKERERDRETKRDARRKSLFDWPVAFIITKLMVANCSLAKCPEKHVNHMK